ncbi:MAG TPA: hypothetical protein DET40_07805 [Lentisphaeria bacterium]|nr:MAG: hypothetical protein A2X45_11780 [Lentisphaerae bacterium GWF2_50_93]HCE43438.1 hypothetical protein [Lentisphaeria bacterium]
MKKMMMIVTVAVLGICSMVFLANEMMAQAPAAKPEVKTVTKEVNEWCTVTTPESAKVGDTVEVKIALKGVKAPAKLNCHLHFQKEGGEYGGFWVYAEPVDVAEANGTFSFKFTLAEKEGAVNAIPTIFLGPDGDWKNKTASCAGAAFPVTK